MPPNLISLVRDLQRRRARRRRGLAVAEGVRLVEEAMGAGLTFRGVLADPNLPESPRGATLLRDLSDHNISVQHVSEPELAGLADTETPQGILAVVETPRWSLGNINPVPGHPVLVLDGVQDPGNVGTLLRTAYALGSPGAILLKGTADLANPKVVRSAMGATFRLPSVRVEQGELTAWVRERGIRVWAAASQGTALTRLTPPEYLAVVIGNEGAGVRPAVRSLAEEQVAIPLARGAESLNVAVAAGVIFYQVRHAD